MSAGLWGCWFLSLGHSHADTESCVVNNWVENQATAGYGTMCASAPYIGYWDSASSRMPYRVFVHANAAKSAMRMGGQS